MNREGIDAEKVELPSGNHRIKISVADTKGGTTSTMFVGKVQ